MTYETLTLEADGPIARIWLDRPEKLNALNARAVSRKGGGLVDAPGRGLVGANTEKPP
jgi:enoyl-CoA hydratase/carnithine racemase